MRTLPAFLVLATLLVLPMASALIATTPTRLDAGARPVGELAHAITVANKGDAPTAVEVHVHTLDGERILVEPESLQLAPGERAQVLVRLLVEGNTSGGRHDPRIEFVEVPVTGAGQTLGRAAVSVPVVFWVENLKIGNLQTQNIQVGEAAKARILVQNFHVEPVEPLVILRVVDASGAEVARQEAPIATIDVNASSSVEMPVPTESLRAGAYTLVGEASHAGRTSNAWTTTLLIGERRLSVAAPIATVLDGGRVELRAIAQNVGTVPLAGSVEFSLVGPDAHAATTEPFDLAPGDAQEAKTAANVPPGAYTVYATVFWPEGHARADGIGFTVANVQAEVNATPVPALLALAAIAIGVVARRRS